MRICVEGTASMGGAEAQNEIRGTLSRVWPYRVFFAHANGFPARSYSTFLRALSPMGLRYVPFFGHGAAAYTVARNWKPLLLQCLDYLPQGGTPWVGIGHSMGAILILQAYYARPAAFSHLVLMDPPLFAPMKQWSIALAQKLGQPEWVISPARKAKHRRTYWVHHSEAAQYMSTRALFKHFHPQALQDYLQYALKETKEGHFCLRFSKKIEYRIFCSTPARVRFAPLHIPCYFLYSKQYAVCTCSDIRYLCRKLPAARFISMKGGHMFPLEQPQETAQCIQSLIP